MDQSMISSEAIVLRTEGRPRIEWLRCLPFLLMHVACLAVFLVGWSWTELPPEDVIPYVPCQGTVRSMEYS